MILIPFFLHFSNQARIELFESDLEASIANLEIPEPSRRKELEKDRTIYISHYKEDEKAYIVKESSQNQYKRESGLFHYIKITTSDQKYRLNTIVGKPPK